MPVRFTPSFVEGASGPDSTMSGTCREYVDSLTQLRLSVTRLGHRTFLVRGTLNGRKICMRIGDASVVSLKAAREVAMKFRADLEMGLDPRIAREQRRAVPYFDAFAADYLKWAVTHKGSHDDDASKIRIHLLPAFGMRLMSDIAARDIQAYIADKSKTLSKATLNRHLSLLSRMFRLAIQWELLDHNPCKGIDKFKESAGRMEFFSVEEIRRLLVAAESESNVTAVLAIKTLLFTGLRREEVLKCRKEDLDLVNGVLFLPVTKSGRSRNVVLNDSARAVLREAMDRSVSPVWVFPGKDPAKPVCNIRKAYERILSAAGLPRLTIHHLRHSHISVLVQSGVPLYHVQALVSHASPQTTQRYAHLASHNLRDASQAFVRALGK